MTVFSTLSFEYDRILKVARTIVNLAGEQKNDMSHIAEAIHYRNLDRLV